jgi:hypothetical protein
MMDKNFHRKRTCFICGHVETATTRGFSDAGMYCGKHLNDEIEFHQALPERNRMSKEHKALERIYAKRWKGKEIYDL